MTNTPDPLQPASQIVRTRAELDAVPVGSLGIDPDGGVMLKVSETDYSYQFKDEGHRYGADEIAGEYNEDERSRFFPIAFYFPDEAGTCRVCKTSLD